MPRACLLVDVSTTDGKASGLRQNSVVGCLFLATIAETRISAPIGKLPPATMQKINDYLKAALELP